MRIIPMIIGGFLIVLGIPAYLYAPKLASQFMSFFMGTSSPGSMTNSMLQQFGVPPINELDQMFHYSFGGLAVAGFLIIIFGIFAKKKFKKQFSNTDKKLNKIAEETQENSSIKGIQILKERLAKGEITADDFVDLKKLLE